MIFVAAIFLNEYDKTMVIYPINRQRYTVLILFYFILYTKHMRR